MTKLSIENVNDAFFQAVAQSGGTKTNFTKLNAGDTYLRLLSFANESDPTPFRINRVHDWKIDGRFQKSMEFGYLVGMPALLERAIDEGKVSNEDIALYKAHGDPFTKLAEKQQAAGQKVAKGLWARTRYIMNVVNRDADGEVAILEIGPQLVKMIGGVLQTFDDLFDAENGRDILIKGNNKAGLQRRYESVSPAKDPSPVGFEYELIDLDAVMLRSIVPYTDKVDALFRVHGELAAQYGLNDESFTI
jgi:hypothetical protein